MAIPAEPVFIGHGAFERGIERTDHEVGVFMAPFAVFLDHALARFVDSYHKRLLPKSEDVSMPHPVLGFEIILAEDVILGYMAVVARGMFPVRAVEPGRVVRCHHMAVHARLR